MRMDWLHTVLLLMLPVALIGGVKMVRYPVGEPVPVEVYTTPFDPCDPAYKFLAPPPKDWAMPFGNNERTMLLHAVSELRVIVAVQGKRLIELEKWQKDQPPWSKPYEKPDGWRNWDLGSRDPNGLTLSLLIDPNEVKE